MAERPTFFNDFQCDVGPLQCLVHARELTLHSVDQSVASPLSEL